MRMQQLIPVEMASRLCVSILPVLFCLVLGIEGMPGPAMAEQAPVTQLVRLAGSLRNAPDPVRMDFAWLAITEMVAIYKEEAVRARRESRHSGRARDGARWAAAVDAYAAEIREIADGLTTATPVGITIGAGNSVLVYVAGRPVSVTGAISGQQAIYEQRVIERFCALYSCDQLLEEFHLPAPESEPVDRDTSVHWSFSQHAGPACVTSDGLELQFRDMSDLRKKRLACERAVADLYALAVSIGRQKSSGTRIDWNGLVIDELPGGERHQVTLNAEGDSVRLELPALAQTPELFRRVRPWLAARVSGNHYRLVVLNVEPLIAPLTVPHE